MGLCQIFFKAFLAGLTNQRDISDSFAVTPLEMLQKNQRPEKKRRMADTPGNKPQTVDFELSDPYHSGSAWQNVNSKL